MQDDIFAGRQGWCLTIYTACYFTACWNMQDRTRLHHDHMCTQSVVPLSFLPDPYITRSFTVHIWSGQRTWYFCQVCWFKLPYQLERQERPVPASRLHTIDLSKYLPQKLLATFQHAVTASWFRTSPEVELTTLNQQVVWNSHFKSLHLKVQMQHRIID